MQDRFGNHIFDLSFMTEPHPHLVVRLAGDEAVPSGLREFGAYRVDVRFEIGAGGEVGDGIWERLPEAAGSAGD